jgi:hypothetical protein
MSIGNPALAQSSWKKQPFKGLLFIGIIAAISAVFELFFGQVFRLDVNSKLVYITICFVWWWHLGFSLNGYPGSRFSSGRFGRGTVNLAVLLVLVYLTGEVWKFISTKTSLTDTSVGLWGQTAIIAACASLFFFDNTIVTTDQVRNWHPVSGLLNIFFAVFVIAPALTFLPQIWGLDPFYIPWYWYPLSTVFGSFFERWPLNHLNLGMPRLGFLHTGAVLLLTLIMALFLKQAGMDLFTTTSGPTFAAIWTTVGLGLLWQFNLWPFNGLAQPAKGIVTSLISLVISLLLYAATEAVFGQANIIQGLYWWFNILWVQVFLMAPGLYDGIGLWQSQPNVVQEEYPVV